jgi:glycosyltransferase involved in cell wall biosynthesis
MKTFDICRMPEISVVIICRNEAGIIGRTLESLEGLSRDIVVYDSGSSDGTREIAREKGARVMAGEWKGYGPTKRLATSFARHDWILSLDADETVSEKLKASLQNLDLSDPYVAYELKFLNHLGEKPVKYGEWGGDRHTRLFNRTVLNWNDAEVHENLEIPPGVKVKPVEGYVLHYTARDLDKYAEKLKMYAALNAEKYQRQGKKSNWLKRNFAPVFSFVRNYIFRLGFLDGKAGFQCARMTARYTYQKYAKLQKLNRG